MGQYIMHHEGRFFMWSTVVDAPVTNPMIRAEFDAYYLAEYGRDGMRNGYAERMDRVMATGTSCIRGDFDSVVYPNRMGDDEACLTIDQVKAWVMAGGDKE